MINRRGFFTTVAATPVVKVAAKQTAVRFPEPTKTIRYVPDPSDAVALATIKHWNL